MDLALLQRAFDFAAKAHDGQVRKGRPVAFVSHLMAVSALVIEHGGDGEEASAALLHDTLEDTSTTVEDLERGFGARVAGIVVGCTDNLQPCPPAWRDRKARFILCIAGMDASVRLVVAADKLHNARDVVRSQREFGDRAFRPFMGGKEGTVWYYGAALEALERMEDARLTGILGQLRREVVEMRRLAGGGGHRVFGRWVFRTKSATQPPKTLRSHAPFRYLLPPMEMYGDIPVCGAPVDLGALEQIERSRATCEYAALMADHHKGYGVPIGGVVASQVSVSPTAVGFDIACGNMAARLDLPASKVRENIAKIMDRIAAQISFGLGQVAGWEVEDPLFDSPLWDELPAFRQTTKGRTLKDTARYQLGTVGGGNHYVDLFTDEDDRVWIGVHFGSRGFGHKTATWFLDAAHASQDMEAPPTWLAVRSDLGEQYVKALSLAGRYAYAGREAVVAKVAEIMEASVVESVHNHHNFAWEEEHDGRSYWVCRKGATPAMPGQKGFVGGSMGDDAVIVEGIESSESKELFYSTVHGAGRVMSRTAATGRSRWGKKKGEGLITKDAMMDWVRERGIELRGADVDEAPQAYKRLAEVLPQQGDTIRVLHTLRPIGVVMAGADVVDPYKD